MTAGRTAENLALVERGYEALERDDIPALLELCAAEAEWRYPAEGELPYGGQWLGRDAINLFMDAHEEAEEILDFRIDDMLAGDGRVVVFGFFKGRAKPTGRVWETRFVHAVDVANGAWVRLEAYFDTAAAVRAHQP